MITGVTSNIELGYKSNRKVVKKGEVKVCSFR